LGRLLPLEPRQILPRFDLKSPLPMSGGAMFLLNEGQMYAFCGIFKPFLFHLLNDVFCTRELVPANENLSNIGLVTGTFYLWLPNSDLLNLT